MCTRTHTRPQKGCSCQSEFDSWEEWSTNKKLALKLPSLSQSLFQRTCLELVEDLRGSSVLEDVRCPLVTGSKAWRVIAISLTVVYLNHLA